MSAIPAPLTLVPQEHDTSNLSIADVMVELRVLKIANVEMQQQLKSITEMVGNILALSQSGNVTSRAIDAGSPSNSVVVAAVKAPAKEVGGKTAITRVSREEETRKLFLERAFPNNSAKDEVDQLYSNAKSVNPTANESALWKKTLEALYDKRDRAGRALLAKVAVDVNAQHAKTVTLASDLAPVSVPVSESAFFGVVPPLASMAPVFNVPTPL